MNKLFVTVYVPLLGQNYDVFIPINKKVGTVKEIIINTINELADNNISNIENIKLYDKETCSKIDNNIYVKSSGIINGTTLILL